MPFYDGMSPTTYGTMTPAGAAIGAAVGIATPVAVLGGVSLLAPGAEAAVEGGLSFSQTTASPFFSAEGNFAGQSIADVAGQLRAGTLAVGDVPVQTISLGGNQLIVNTRSALSLMQAGISQSEWAIADMTGDAALEAQIGQRLINNGLSNLGTDVLRITGLGRNASTLIPGP